MQRKAPFQASLVRAVSFLRTRRFPTNTSFYLSGCPRAGSIYSPAQREFSLASRTAPMQISKADREAYQRDGVVCLRNVFSEEWRETLCKGTQKALKMGNPDIEELSAAYLEAAAKKDREERSDDPEVAVGRFCSEMDCSRKHPEFASFVLESPAAEVAASVMGATTCNFFYDILFVKEPKTVERTVWHQDAPYWAIDGDQVCSVWLPLDPIPRDNCLEFVAGSHRWPLFAPFFFSSGEVYPEYRDSLPELPPIQSLIRSDDAGDGKPSARWVEFEGKKHAVLSWEMAPGDCLVFQRNIVHGAPPNAHERLRRRAFSTRWAGDDAVFAPDYDPAGRQLKGYPNFQCPGLGAGEPLGRFPSAFPLLYCAEGAGADAVGALQDVRAKIERQKAAGAGGEEGEFEGLSRLLLPGGAGGEYVQTRRETAKKYSSAKPDNRFQH